MDVLPATLENCYQHVPRRAHFLLYKWLTFKQLTERWSGRRDSNPRSNQSPATRQTSIFLSPARTFLRTCALAGTIMMTSNLARLPSHLEQARTYWATVVPPFHRAASWSDSYNKPLRRPRKRKGLGADNLGQVSSSVSKNPIRPSL